MANLKIESFKPARDWILIEDPRKTETESGIILPESISDKMQTNICKVIAVGPTAKEVTAGDTIMVNPQMPGTITMIDKKEYVMVPEHFVMGVWPN